MDFIFIGLSLGCIIFLGKIVLDYFNEVPIWKEKIEQADIEMAQYEAEIQDLTQQKASASEQSKTIEDEISKMEAMASELKSEIAKTKKEMARKGKIVMRREPDQEFN
jgi:chromosome segregation ATPase